MLPVLLRWDTCSCRIQHTALRTRVAYVDNAETTTDQGICGYYYRRVIDQSVLPGEVIIVDFNTMNNVKQAGDTCTLTLFNGQVALSSASQTPISMKVVGSETVGMNCVDPNKVRIPENLSFQILTLQWTWNTNGKRFNSCADVYVKSGTTNQKFFAKTDAQAYLDTLENFDGVTNYTGLWIGIGFFAIILLAAIVCCLTFCCRSRVGAGVT